MPSVLIEEDVPARMQDGVTLYADVYRPAESGCYPVLLCRMPYGKQLYLPMSGALLNPVRAAQAGYVVIIQDTRGRYTSEGQFTYLAQMPQEGPDGYDTVEWAASLPYSNGNVGLFGISYFGWTQWAAAMLRPPHLRAVVPMQALVGLGEGIGQRRGAFELGANLAWHLFTSIDTTTRQLVASGASGLEIFGAIRTIVAAMDRLSENGYTELPLRDLPSLRELGLNDLLRYLFQRAPGNWPAEYNLVPSAVEVPSLNIGGWFDIFAQGTLDTYTALRSQGRGQGRQAHLLVGPWSHGNVGGGFGTTMGEMEFGLAAGGALVGFKGDLTTIHLRWFDHWLKGIDNGVDKEAPVQVFLTGENRWVELPDWPPPGADEQSLYFTAMAGLSASLSPAVSGISRYAYDPADPAPTLGGNVLMPGVYGVAVKDQRPLSQRPDVLTFTGRALSEPLKVMGRVVATLWISSSVPDTDFVVRLLDIHSNGYMQNVCDGITRTRYRESLTEASWLEPGQIYEITVDLWSVAHVFKPGHRIGIQVTSSSFPRWDRNWNTKDEPGAAIGGPVAQQTIWHDPEHPSHITLPVVR